MNATAGQLSDVLVYSAMALYAVAMVAYAAAGAVRRTAPAPSLVAVGHGSTLTLEPTGADPARPRTAPDRTMRSERVAMALTLVAFLLHLGAVVARGLAAGRVPWGNMYEFALTGSVAATGAYLVMLRRQPIRDVGAWIVALVLLVLGLGVTVLYVPAVDLVPALDSYWLVIHVVAAIVCGGVFTVGAAVAVLLLVRLRVDRLAAGGRDMSRQSSRLPTAAVLDRVVYAAHVFAFPLWTFAVIAGAIWAENAWGRYWGWDPKETWAFITWVLYACYLHAQATAGWRGRKATWFVLAAYVAFVFNFFGVNLWITGLHSYAGL